MVHYVTNFEWPRMKKCRVNRGKHYFGKSLRFNKITRWKRPDRRQFTLSYFERQSSSVSYWKIMRTAFHRTRHTTNRDRITLIDRLRKTSVEFYKLLHVNANRIHKLQQEIIYDSVAIETFVKMKLHLGSIVQLYQPRNKLYY